MDRLVYTALTGLQRAAEAQAVTAHNLANVSTPGFRREMAALSAGYVAGGGASAGARVQSGGEAPHDLLKPGRLEQTGRPLDIAMEGDAWLAVQDPGGGEALTRRGDLRLDADGRLRLVTPDPATLERGPDGLFRSPGADADPAATVSVGTLERSNVEPAAALVELVQQSRSFELQTKLLSAAREMDEGSAALMRVE
jgi:flagellar basal-body rod protein FlgF